MKFTHVEYDESVNISPSRPILDFFQSVLGFFVLILLFYIVVVFSINLLLPHVSVDGERWIWNHLMKEPFKDHLSKQKTDPEVQKQLQQLLDRMPKTGLPNYDYQIIFVEDSDINAMALPAGKIIVFRGLLDAVKSENGLAFVIGHELGHYANRDHLRGIGTGLITQLMLLSIGVSDMGSNAIMDQIDYSINMFFSRAQETKADAFGLEVLNSLYGHVGGADELFNEIKKRDDTPLISRYNSTHPLPNDRIQHLQDLIEQRQMKKRDPTPLTFK